MSPARRERPEADPCDESASHDSPPDPGRRAVVDEGGRGHAEVRRRRHRRRLLSHRRGQEGAPPALQRRRDPDPWTWTDEELHGPPDRGGRGRGANFPAQLAECGEGGSEAQRQGPPGQAVLPAGADRQVDPSGGEASGGYFRGWRIPQEEGGRGQEGPRCGGALRSLDPPTPCNLIGADGVEGRAR